MNLLQLRTKLLAILNRNDCSDELANDFINMAQTRIERTLRIPGMEKMSVSDGTDAQATNAIVIPPDFLSLKYLYSGDCLMENKDLGRFLRLSDSGGTPRYYSRVGASFLIKPSLAEGDEVLMVYYAAQPVLTDDTDTNLFSFVAADLLLYGARSYACDYFVDDRLPGYEQRYTNLFNDLDEQGRLTDMEQSAQQIAPATHTEY
jgi:hypothetical protein